MTQTCTCQELYVLGVSCAGDPVLQPLPALPAPGAAETRREEMEEVYG